MPNHKQTAKRNRQASRQRATNRVVVGRMRTALKDARAAIATSDDNRAAAVKLAISLIDRAVTKGAVKRNTASRTISRLVRRASA